jgi:hypothetical protein
MPPPTSTCTLKACAATGLTMSMTARSTRGTRPQAWVPVRRASPRRPPRSRRASPFGSCPHGLALAASADRTATPFRCPRRTSCASAVGRVPRRSRDQELGRGGCGAARGRPVGAEFILKARWWADSAFQAAVPGRAASGEITGHHRGSVPPEQPRPSDAPRPPRCGQAGVHPVAARPRAIIPSGRPSGSRNIR